MQTDKAWKSFKKYDNVIGILMFQIE